MLLVEALLPGPRHRSMLGRCTSHRAAAPAAASDALPMARVPASWRTTSWQTRQLRTQFLASVPSSCRTGTPGTAVCGGWALSLIHI
eukprot:1177581-Alexandrium_andersonii.AAC.1